MPKIGASVACHNAASGAYKFVDKQEIVVKLLIIIPPFSYNKLNVTRNIKFNATGSNKSK